MLRFLTDGFGFHRSASPSPRKESETPVYTTIRPGSTESHQAVVMKFCPSLIIVPQSGVGGVESPCDVFSQIEFPIDAFFPSRNEPCIQPSESCTGCYRTVSTS